MKLNERDKIGFTFCGTSPTFFERGPSWINFKNVADIVINDIRDMIVRIFQSNSEGLGTDTFCLTATVVEMPVGEGPRV